MNIILIFLITLFLISIINTKLLNVKSITARTKTLRNLNTENNFLSRAFGDSHDLNYYYTTLYLGKKQVPQTYIIDTGNSITTLTCNKCKICGNHLNKYFGIDNESQIIKCQSNQCFTLPSSCNTNHQCSFSISYAEGSSLSGFYVNQDVYLEI